MKRTSNIVIGVFDDRADAEQALHALKAAGFAPDHIDVAALQSPESEEAMHTPGGRPSRRVDEGTGVLAGGILGGVAGWLIAASTIAVPGLGALVAAGALVGALGGAGIGAAAGGLVGYLVDHGLAHEEAQYYHERVRHGSVLVAVRDTTRISEAQAILQRLGGHDFQTRPSP
ncbi:MAG: hypothetical protein AB7P40_26920 [Chloroflexota bacterium]